MESEESSSSASFPSGTTSLSSASSNSTLYQCSEVCDERVAYEKYRKLGGSKTLDLADCNDLADATEAARLGVEAINQSVGNNSSQQPDANKLRVIRILDGTIRVGGGKYIKVQVMAGDYCGASEQLSASHRLFHIDQHKRRVKPPTLDGSSNDNIVGTTITLDALWQSKIRYRELATFSQVLGGCATLRDGTPIPRVGLSLAPLWREEAMECAVKRALSAGIRLFDYAHFDVLKGEFADALKRYLPRFKLARTDIFICAKFTISLNHDDNAFNCSAWESQEVYTLSRKADGLGSEKKNPYTQQLIRRVEKCCGELGYLDLALIHSPKVWRPHNVDDANGNNDSQLMRKVYVALWECRARGLIRGVGVANFEANHLDDLMALNIERRHATINETAHEAPSPIPCYNLPPPLVNQCEMHLDVIRKELLAKCLKLGIFLQAHSIFPCWRKMKRAWDRRLNEMRLETECNEREFHRQLSLNSLVGKETSRHHPKMDEESTRQHRNVLAIEIIARQYSTRPWPAATDGCVNPHKVTKEMGGAYEIITGGHTTRRLYSLSITSDGAKRRKRSTKMAEAS